MGHGIAKLFLSQFEKHTFVSIYRGAIDNRKSNLKGIKTLRINADLLTSDLLLTKLHAVIKIRLVL